MTIEALDLFAGTGWGVACQRLGIDEDGVDNMHEVQRTRAAAGMKTIHDDVWTLGDTIPDLATRGLIASPPCQSFSQAGKGRGRQALDQVLFAVETGMWTDIDMLRQLARDVEDDRTALVLTPLHYAYKLRPRWIALEQVPTVLPVWLAVAEALNGLGYKTVVGNLQAEQYGVPQTRKRAFLLASLDKQPLMPVPTHSRYYPRTPERLDPGMRKWVSMAEALDWYADVTMRSNYGTGGDPAKRGERHLGEPAPTVTSKIDRNKWIDNYELRMTKMPNSSVRRPDQPAPTICFGNDAASARWMRRNSGPGAARNPRPTEHPAYTIRAQGSGSHPCGVELSDPARRITVKEAGILQSYPADFPWQGRQGKQYLQVGNAVPPLLAEAVLKAVIT